MSPWRLLLWLLVLGGHAGAAVAACSFSLGTVSANPASLVVGSTVAVLIPIDYAGCRETPLAVTARHPAGVAYARCSTGGAWSCASVSATPGATTSSFEPGNNGRKSDTLELTYTATGAGTHTITVTGSAAASSPSVSFTVTGAARAPTAATNPASGVTATGATLNGSVGSNGAATTVGFAYGRSAAYGSAVAASPSALSDDADGAAVSATLSGLDCATTYHYRVQASNAAGTTNGSDASFTTPACLPQPALEYLFNEAAWSGAAGEVQDSSGNGHHGTASGLAGSTPTTAATSPAVAGSSGSCSYGVFKRSSKDYVALPTTFPNLGASSSFTITAWIRTTDPTQRGQRIFADDQSNSRGFAVSLGDGGAGRLRFFQRGAGSNVILDTGAVVAGNSWYFVAAVADTAARTRQLYVFGADGALLASPSVSYSAASFGVDTGPASVGGETNASGERTSSFGFAGNLDEIRVHAAALSRDQIDLVRGLTRICSEPTAKPDHYELSVPERGISCLASTVTVTACTDGSSPCTGPYAGASGHTVTLATSAGALGSTTLRFDATGTAVTTLRHPAATAGAVATVSLAGESLPAGSARQCCQGGSCRTAGHCSTVFDPAGFVIADRAGGAAATIATQTAGSASGSLVLRAVRMGSDAPVCEAALTGAASVDWSYTCNDPTTCSAGQRTTITAAGTVAVAGNPNTGGGSRTAVPMHFDADGNAPFSFTYGDVGRITLHAGKAAGGSLLTSLNGASNAFVVKPAGFVLSNIKCSSYSAGACATAAIASPGNNPAAASSAGTAFIPAGQAFSATVTAVDATGGAVHNFGQETRAEGVTLTPALVLPAGGTAGSLSNRSGFGAFSNGAAAGTAFAYSEVGIITLTPSLSSGNYLGSGSAVAGTPSGHVGRFIPNHFTTVVTPGCSASFTYSGQPFAATVTAHNAAGATVANYGGTGFAKAVSLAAAGAPGIGSFTAGGSVAAAAFAGGIAAAAPAYTFTDKLTAPGTLMLRATDTDGVSSAGHAEGSTALRSGRLRLANAFGRENAPLQIAALADYWSGGAWVLNGADSCTTVPAAAVALSHQRNGQGAATTAWHTTPSAIDIASGSGVLTLGAPSPSGTGSIDIGLNLGSGGADQSCLDNHPASTGAGLEWLRSRNGACAASFDRDPSARASFGIFSPETKRTVHVRERF